MTEPSVKPSRSGPHATVTPLRPDTRRPAEGAGHRDVTPKVIHDAHGPGPGEEHDFDSGLVVRGLTKKFKKRPVLRGVSVSLRRGEAVGLLGPNGAGKTT